MQDQPTTYDRIAGYMWRIILIVWTVAVIVLVASATAAQAGTTDAFGKPAWSNARLTTHMKLANAQISLHDRMLNRHAARIKAAREDATAALAIANQTYEDLVRWTLTLIGCIREPEGQEEACLDAALSSELLPEPYAEQE